MTTHERVQTVPALDAALSKGGWDIILSDYHMPLMSGLTAFLLLEQRHVEIPFVLVSGTLGSELEAVAKRVGVREYLLKEAAYEKLVPAVERALQAAARRPPPERPE